MSWMIRSPRPHELVSLREIETAAGALFAGVGLSDVAAHEPLSIEELTAYLVVERIWVLVEGTVPVGYALADVVDGVAHLEQLSVTPEHGRRGHGGALLEHVCEWARGRGLAAVTLTTFEHVAWNAPYYARRGFRVLADDEIGPELRRQCQEEAQHGLDPALRVCMRRDL